MDAVNIYEKAARKVGRGEINLMEFWKIIRPLRDVEVVRHGRWECSDDAYESAVCSYCGWDTTEPWVHIKEWFEFCPHCGADMREDGGND